MLLGPTSLTLFDGTFIPPIRSSSGVVKSQLLAVLFRKYFFLQAHVIKEVLQAATLIIKHRTR
ncbi:hypothetical protein C5167_042876 [Papaver somniferum]|uniref:Uncharacterized protein n=1 Tax=Papaver somniferum TaxID=3469 RepID=A0A4Y7L6R2_PAPSO|nr:hypothetical protein C5167_042876 [Papaver somniferum]